MLLGSGCVNLVDFLLFEEGVEVDARLLHGSEERDYAGLEYAGRSLSMTAGVPSSLQTSRRPAHRR